MRAHCKRGIKSVDEFVMLMEILLTVPTGQKLSSKMNQISKVKNDLGIESISNREYFIGRPFQFQTSLKAISLFITPQEDYTRPMGLAYHSLAVN